MCDSFFTGHVSIPDVLYARIIRIETSPHIIHLYVLHVVRLKLFIENCICYKNDLCSPESKALVT